MIKVECDVKAEVLEEDFAVEDAEDEGATSNIDSQCAQCGKVLSNKWNLIQHVNTVHGEVKFECDQCDYKATQKVSLTRHKQSKHSGVSYACDICVKDGVCKVFKWEVDLNRHIRSIHEGIKYSCGLCGVQLSTQRSLSLHIKVVHEGRKFKCDTCGYLAITKQYLRVHNESVHLGIKYSCDFDNCDYEASHKGDLKRHKEEYHEGLKKFCCEKCGFAARRKYILAKHMKDKHKINLRDHPEAATSIIQPALYSPLTEADINVDSPLPQADINLDSQLTEADIKIEDPDEKHEFVVDADHTKLELDETDWIKTEETDVKY